jgi:hypothetical protein
VTLASAHTEEIAMTPDRSSHPLLAAFALAAGFDGESRSMARVVVVR